ncbi:MAG: cytidylate kinase family protein [Pseudonocardiaceae bacterium]
MLEQHLAISGDLGSGKSTVAAILAQRTGGRLISTGMLQRDIAAKRGISTLQANLDAETDESIDLQIDGMLLDEGQTGPPTVFDSRMAWHFVPSALKIHIVVAPDIGAERIYNRTGSAVEKYDNVGAAQAAVEARAASEQARFLGKYQVDISRLSNYDVVIDSSDASQDDIIALIEHVMNPVTAPQLWISPRRVIPTGSCMQYLQPDSEQPVADDPEGSIVCYARPYFFAIRGYRELSAAIRTGRGLVSAELEAEGDDKIAGGLSVAEYLHAETTLSCLRDWENAHDFRFSHYPRFLKATIDESSVACKRP